MLDLAAEHPQLAEIVSTYDFDLIGVQAMDTFTHTSFYGVPKEPFSAQSGMAARDYERKELWGDSILQFAISMLLRHMFPLLTVGTFTELRSRLVNNRTLAVISTHFGLHEHLQAGANQAKQLKDNVHVRSALFEAYLCSLYDEQGLDIVWAFITRCFKPIAKLYHDQLYWEKTAPQGARTSSPAVTASSSSASSSGFWRNPHAPAGPGHDRPKALGGPRPDATIWGGAGGWTPEIPPDSAPVPEGNWVGSIKEWSDKHEGSHYTFSDGECNEVDSSGSTIQEQVLTIGHVPGVDYVVVRARATRKKVAQQRAAYRACQYLHLV